jgi:hypothetical protein
LRRQQPRRLNALVSHTVRVYSGRGSVALTQRSAAREQAAATEQVLVKRLDIRDRVHLGLVLLVLIAAACLSCSSDGCKCTEPEPAQVRITYIFREAVSMCCPACDPCWYLYWRFECVADSCHYLGHYDPRDGQEEPVWLDGVSDIEYCYDYGYSTCTEGLWAYCSDPSLTPRPNEEAEEAALWLSCSLVAPQDLYDLLVHDLALIRAEWGDSITELNTITFQPILLSNDLAVTLSASDFERFTRGEYKDLDSLNTLFGATELRPWLYHSVRITFNGRYNMWRLAEVYQTVPSVLFAEPGDSYMFICRPSTVLPWPVE